MSEEEKIYTREEVKNLIISVFLAKHNEGSDFIMQDWIKENLRTQNKEDDDKRKSKGVSTII